ncbi:MAG: hypothetical protein ACK4KV_19330 [Rhodocyclaceae bacterium]
MAALLVLLVLAAASYMLFAWIQLRSAEQSAQFACDQAEMGMDIDAYMSELSAYAREVQRVGRCVIWATEKACERGDSGWLVMTVEKADLVGSRYVCVVEFSAEHRVRSRQLRYVD